MKLFWRGKVDYVFIYLFLFLQLKALDKLVHFYKEWHFHFMPKYDYKYFLDRCTEFGKNNLLKVRKNILFFEIDFAYKLTKIIYVYRPIWIM